jgi:hypothetical protein
MVLLLCILPLLAFTETISEQPKVRPHENSIFDKFLHAIHQAISIATRQESLIPRLTLFWEMSVRFRD